MCEERGKTDQVMEKLFLAGPGTAKWSTVDPIRFTVAASKPCVAIPACSGGSLVG